MKNPVTALGAPLIGLLIAAIFLGGRLEAQDKFVKRVKDRVGNRVQDTVAGRVAKRAGEATDKALDAVEDVARPVNDSKAGAAGDAGHAADPGEDGFKVTAQGTKAKDTQAAATGKSGSESFTVTGIQDEEVWSRYDFIPGERSLFVEDFTDDPIGDFPRRLELIRGNVDVVEAQGRRFVRSRQPTTQLAVALPEILPERFTIELDLYSQQGMHGFSIATTRPKSGSTTWPHYHQSSYFSFAHRGGSGVRTKEELGPISVTDDRRPMSEVVTARVAVDGSWVKVYIDENRVANVPNALIERTDRLYFITDSGGEDKPTYLGNLRIAAGGAQLASTLAEAGRAVARGLLFDTNSATLLPESTAVLREIAQALNDDPALRLGIEGHTDSTGNEEVNQQLSTARADAVRHYLIGARGVDPQRLEARGLGATVPIDSNATAEGRRNNRRVELVVLDEVSET